MNRRLAFALFALVLAASALAALPTRAVAGVRLGLKAGIATSQLGSDLVDLKWRSGVGGGASLALGLTPNIDLAPELLWMRKGSTFTSTNVTVGGITFGKIETGIDIDYVTIPVLLRLHTSTEAPLAFMLVGGPTIGFKAGEKLKTTGLVGVSLDSDQIETFDYGLAIGAGLLGTTGGLNWTVEARYEHGLANVSKLPFGGDLKNGSVQAFAGLEFPILGH